MISCGLLGLKDLDEEAYPIVQAALQRRWLGRESSAIHSERLRSYLNDAGRHFGVRLLHTRTASQS